MPAYRYTALNLDNKRVTDTLDAKDVNDLKRILMNRDLVPLRFREIDKSRGAYRMKSSEVAEFSRQLSSMLGSGITAVRAIDIIKNRDFKPKLKEVYSRLHADVQQGHSISESMKMQANAFPELLANMYASGEASGQLETVASKMAVHYEKEHRLNGKIKTAMTYPTILLVTSIIVVMLIFALILPEFFGMFEGIELPGLTMLIMRISGFVQTGWYLLVIGALIAVALVRFLLTVPPVRLKFDLLKLRLPVAGKLLKIIYTARFSRTLSSLYTSGVSMLTALDITSTVLGNKYIASQFAEVIKDVRNGEPLSDAIAKVDGFDRKLSDTIVIGEESGRLDAMLESISESFDYEAEEATMRLVQLVEPIMIALMSVIILLIMLSVMLPMFAFYQQADQLF